MRNEALDRGTSIETTERRFSGLSTVTLDLKALYALPDRLTEGMMRDLQEIIDCPHPDPEPCDATTFAQTMRAISILPMRQEDEASGELRNKLYRRMLGSHTSGAISFLCEQVLTRCKFFPTISECLEILSDYREPQSDLSKAKQFAAHRIKHERTLQFDEAMKQLRDRVVDQAKIDAMPEEWRKHAETYGYLWLLKDGRYIARPDTLAMTEEQRVEHRKRVDQMRQEGLLP